MGTCCSKEREKQDTNEQIMANGELTSNQLQKERAAKPADVAVTANKQEPQLEEDTDDDIKFIAESAKISSSSEKVNVFLFILY